MLKKISDHKNHNRKINNLIIIQINQFKVLFIVIKIYRKSKELLIKKEQKEITNRKSHQEEV